MRQSKGLAPDAAGMNSLQTRYYHKLDDCPFNIAVWTRPTVVEDDSWLRAFRHAPDSTYHEPAPLLHP